MSVNKITPILQRIYESPSRDDIRAVLSSDHDQQLDEIYAFADTVRKQYAGDGILVRGIVEFSSYCRNTCAYCGLNRKNTSLARYRLTREEVLASVAKIAGCGIRTVVLQSGEDDTLDAGWIADIIRSIKRQYGLAVTLSAGEWDTGVYRLWREAGADRYLLKIETTDPILYAALHPGMSLDNRLRCLDDLRVLGYQTGSGIIVGLKGQTVDSLAGDMHFFREQDFDMIGIGPFIPHAETPLKNEGAGDVSQTLKVLALTRIITRYAHLPATTALGSIGGDDLRLKGLRSGANVLMPNFTPAPYRRQYEIYPGKRCLSEPEDGGAPFWEGMARSAGRYIDYSRGDTLIKK